MKKGDIDGLFEDLRELVKETFLLWHEKWVGFSWRDYYFNHTERVRLLCLEIGGREGARLRELEYAALFHDVTKRYDGRTLVDERGEKVLDDYGFWRTERVMPNPDKENLVTKLYRSYNLVNKPHNLSGGLIAQKVLEKYGFPKEFCSSVASVVAAHLRPYNRCLEDEEDLYDRIENRVLLDADTIDANLGLVAFFRNVQIRTHYAKMKGKDLNLDLYLASLPGWIERKKAFIEKTMTTTSRRMAEERLRRVRQVYSQLVDEGKNYEASLKYGLLGLLRYFMDCNEEPNLKEQLKYLEKTWIPERRKALAVKATTERTSMLRCFERAEQFHSLLKGEVSGSI